MTWEQVMTMPVGLYHTLKGPVLGHVEGSNDEVVRLWAPASVNFMPPGSVVFLPLAFVEKFLDLRISALFGTSTVPEVVMKGYAGYVEQFTKGSYRMQPVVVNAGIDAPEGEHVVSDAPTTEETAAPADA